MVLVALAGAAVAAQLLHGLTGARVLVVVFVAVVAALGLRAAAKPPCTTFVAALLCVVTAAAATRTVKVPADPAHVAALAAASTSATPAPAIDAHVVAVTPLRAGGVRLLLAAERAADPNERRLVGRLYLYVRNVVSVPRPGEWIRFRARLRRIAAYGNPGELDWAGWNARRGIFVTAFLWDGRSLAVVPPGAPESPIARLRTRVTAVIAKGRGSGGALVAALVTGERNLLSASDTVAIRRAGLSHLLAISGLHMALVGGGVLWSAQRLLLATRWARGGFDVTRLAVALSALATLAYAGLSGGGISVLRATLMAAVVSAGAWQGRRRLAAAGLAGATVALSLSMPGVAREAGFQLSFAAVFSILSYSRGGHGQRRPGALAALRVALEVSFLCWGVTSPIVVEHFGRLASYGALATVATAPLASVVVTGGLVAAASVCLGAPPAIAEAAAEGATIAAEFLLEVARWVAELPLAELAPVAPGPLLTAVLAGLPCAALLTSGRVRAVALGGLVALALLLACAGRHERFRSDVLDAFFLSVGQGDAAVLKLPGGAIVLVDAAPPGRGAAIVEPFLRRLRVKRIDVLVLTHVQADHYGGAEELLAALEVGELWLAAGSCDVEGLSRLRTLASARGVRVVEVGIDPAGAGGALPERRGAGWHLTALWPRDPAGRCDENDRSIVVAAGFAGRRLLFTGDIEAAAETALVGAAGAALAADVVTAPHHGSGTSSTPAFVAAAKPRFVVVSAGAGNRYGFPRPETVARYTAAGARVHTTALDGAVHVRVDAAGGIALRTTLR